jgi:hypothetical protein
MQQGYAVVYREDPARTLRLLLAATAAGLIASTVAANPRPGPWTPVRHPDRHQTVAPVHSQHPIHYPRSARMAAGHPDQRPADLLLREFFELHTAMAYEDAVRVAEKLIEISPDLPEARYNHACVMGRLHRGDEALSSLERAVELGWRDLVHLSIDPDLECIRRTARYATVVERLKTLVVEDGVPDDVTVWPARITDLYREVPRLLKAGSYPAATITIVDGGRTVWTATIARSPVRLVANSNEAPLPAGLMTDPGQWLGVMSGLGLGPAVTSRPEPDFLEVVQTGDGGVGLLRWSPTLGCGVLVVAGDRILAGQIASIALGQHEHFQTTRAETGRGNPNNAGRATTREPLK